MAVRAIDLGRSSPRPTPRGGTRPASVTTRSPRPSIQVRSRRQGRRLLITATTTLTVILAFGVAVAHVIVAQNQDRLDKLNRRLDAEQTRYEKLRFQLAELESPERVVATAHNRLGMVEPTQVKYVPPVVANPTVIAEADVTTAPDWRLVKAELAAK